MRKHLAAVILMLMLIPILHAAAGARSLESAPFSHHPTFAVDMSEPDWIESIFGPTDIHGVTGNGRLAVGINHAGTVTVAKWPRPSYHDQLRYRSRSRELPLLGARENDGVLLGLVFDNPRRTLWLRDAPTLDQRYQSETNLLLTEYEFPSEGLRVLVADFVPPDHDALIRQVTIDKINLDAATPTGLVAFANLALCQRKIPYAPVADWLLDPLASDVLSYDATVGLLVQTPSRSDAPDPVAAAFGFFLPADAYQCGQDGQSDDAYLEATTGVLSMNAKTEGQVDGALISALEFSGDTATSAFVLAFGPDAHSATEAVRVLRDQTPQEHAAQTVAAQTDWLSTACLPDTDDPDVLSVSRRALLLGRIVIDEQSGAIGSSIATQPPYAPDWPRDGAYVNLMLQQARFLLIVSDHNRFYAAHQGRLGNWDMNFYGDGVPAGPLFLELDTLGLTTWTLWNHYLALTEPDAKPYLEAVYDAMAAAADFFVWWKNPVTGLPLPAFESDFVTPKSTLLSAGAAWATLSFAQQAGEVVGESPDRLAQWAQRKAQLHEAIFEFYFDPDTHRFIGDPFTRAYMIYPFEFLPPDDPRMQATAEAIWEYIEPIIDGQTNGGSYLGLLGVSLAKAWKNDPDKRPRVEALLEFVVHELPLPGTQLYGECFVNLGDSFEVRTGIPHPMTGALTFSMAAELFGMACPEATDDDDDNDNDNDNDPEDDDSVDDSEMKDESDSSDRACGCP